MQGCLRVAASENRDQRLITSVANPAIFAMAAAERMGSATMRTNGHWRFAGASGAAPQHARLTSAGERPGASNVADHAEPRARLACHGQGTNSAPALA